MGGEEGTEGDRYVTLAYTREFEPGTKERRYALYDGKSVVVELPRYAVSWQSQAQPTPVLVYYENFNSQLPLSLNEVVGVYIGQSAD